MATPILTRTYRSNRDFERDANKLFKKGYHPTSITNVPGHTLWGHTLVKWVTLVGIMTGPSRSSDKVTVVYTHESVAPATARPAHPSPSFSAL